MASDKFGPGRAWGARERRRIGALNPGRNPRYRAVRGGKMVTETDAATLIRSGN